MAVQPYWAWASSVMFHDHTQHTVHAVGLLCTSDRPDAETSTWQLECPLFIIRLTRFPIWGLYERLETYRHVSCACSFCTSNS